MATLLVKVASSMTLDGAQALIMGQHSYLEFVRSFPSFRTIQFTAPSEDQSSIDEIRGLAYVHGATYDKEYKIDPVEGGEVAVAEFETDVIKDNTSEIAGQRNTRIISSVGGGTIYVKVANYGGNLRFQLSSTQGGVYSRIATFSGFVQAGTYTFDQSDSSNTGHRLAFSLTPDGTHKGGSQYTTNVTTAGTPGSSGAYTRIQILADTASVLYWYNVSNADYGAYDDSPLRYGAICVHDFWHLDRISKQARSFMNGSYNTTEEADGVDVYVLDTGIRGASRPTGSGVGLHPELFDVTNNADLNALSEQQAYRVYEVPGYSSGYTVNGVANSNEDDNAHGTWCANLIGGIKSGVAHKVKFYALKCFSSAGGGSLSGIMNAYQAVINHNDSGNANYKGNTRPALINASFGSTQPSGNFPYIELNEAGTDAGFDVELYDETEKDVVDANIVLVRSAGNGFKDASDSFLGPLQGRYQAGTRSAGYSDGDVNTVDVNIASISVGATDYNDFWADFSNYGSGVTVTAPGQHITTPQYDWTTNTPYTSVSNYNVIQGTSFSGPVTAGVVAQFIAANNYNLNTGTLPVLCKNWIRSNGDPGNYAAVSTTAYPSNTAHEYKLPNNPFAVSSGSNVIKIYYNSVDSSAFLNKIGKKVQLRLSSNSLTIGGLNIYDISGTWWGITGQNPASNYIEITVINSGTSNEVAGGSNNYACVISDTHEGTDGPTFGNVALYAELDSEEAGHTGRTIKQIPVDTGVDFDQSQTGALISKVRGLFTQYISKTITWFYNGSISQSGGQGVTNGRIYWDTTGVSVGSYYYQCENHNDMYGTITLSGSGGTAKRYWNVTASGSSNYTIAEQGVTPVVNTYNIAVTAANSSDYTISGTDRTGSISGADAAIVCQVGDTLNFNMNAGGHPLYLKTVQGTGTSNQVSGATGQGAESSGTVSWTPGATGTFYYQCEYHNNMYGTITVQANNTSGQSGDDAGINATPGDILVFDVTAGSSHPFLLKTAQGTGTGNLVTTGKIGGDGFAHNGAISLDIGVDEFKSYANETFNSGETYTLSGDSLSGTGLTFNTTSGVLSGTVVSSYQDTFFDITVTEDSSGEARNYNFHTLGTGVIVTIGDQPSDASIEAGAGTNAQFGPLNASVSDSSTITYQWQYSTGGAWTSISSLGGHSGETTDTLTVDDDYSFNGWQYRCVLDSNTAASSTTSSSATLTVTRVVTISAQPAGTSVVSPAAATFNITAATADGATISYAWDKSEDDAVWHQIPGATSSAYTTSATTYDSGGTPPASFAADSGDYFRCRVNASGASEVVSNSAQLTVSRSISVDTHPQNDTGAVGGTASFSITASISDGDTADIAYQWELSLDDGNNFSTIGGATTSTYTTPTLTAQFDEYQYRCLLTAPGASNTYSNAATLQVETVTVSVVANPDDRTINEGQATGFTAVGTVTTQQITALLNSSFGVGNWTTPAGGGASAKAETAADPELYNSIWSSHAPSVDYQWQKSDGDATITVTVGVDTNAGQSTGVFYFDGVEKAVLEFEQNATYTFIQNDSTNATYGSVHHPLMFSTGADGDHNGNGHYMMGVVYKLDGVTVNMAGYVSGFVAASDRRVEWTVPGSQSSPLYYWCHFHTGQGAAMTVTDQYTDIGGATSPSYNTGTTTYAADHNDRYRCKLSAIGADADVFTDAALLTVYRTHQISSEPVNATGNEGGTSSFTVAGTTSSGSHTYQWSKSDNGVDYNTIPGAVGATYTTPALVFADDNDDRYKCTLSLVGAQNDLVSTFAVQTVLRVISISQQPQAQTVIEGQTATYSITAAITSGSINYQWQKSVNSGADWANINGATSSSYTTVTQPFPTLNNEYRCVLSNANAISVTSDSATITVNESEFVEASTGITVNEDSTTNLTFNRQPTFTANAFVSQYAGSAHAASWWLIKRTSDNAVIYDTAAITVPDLSGGDTGNLTTFTVPAGTLDFQTTYSVQVKFKDNAGLSSNYSTSVQFSTPVVDQPEVQTITPAFNPTINVLTPEFKTGYGHNSTDWQFSQADTFTTIVHQSLGNSTNLLSYTLPGDVTLLPTTTYYVRVRFNVDTV